MKMPIAARRVRNSSIVLRPRSTARNFTVIGPMRAIPAQSKLSARREESVASRGGSTRRLSRPCRQGSTKIRMPCARAVRRSSIPSAQSSHALLDEDVAEDRHRDGVACARLQFDARTEYPWHQADYGGGQGVTRSDYCGAATTARRIGTGPPPNGSVYCLQLIRAACLASRIF